MSRNKIKITRALEVKGYKVEEIEWTPIGTAPIMSGPEGGWYIEFEPMKGMKPSGRIFDYLILGYNINEVLEEIDKLPDCVPRGECKNGKY